MTAEIGRKTLESVITGTVPRESIAWLTPLTVIRVALSLFSELIGGSISYFPLASLAPLVR